MSASKIEQKRTSLPALVWIAAMVAVAALAAAVRLPRLDDRPMHADEANQAVRAAQLWETGVYRYDPDEHHGPSLYWLTLPSLWANGVETLADSDEFDYRIVPACFGIGLVLLAFAVADGLGLAAAAAAAVLAALSPAMVFHARYFIQETLLVFFAFTTIACAWRFLRGGSLAWAGAAGAAIGMMHATKETWILSAAAMAVGLAAAAWSSRKEQRREPRGRLAAGTAWALGIAVVVAVAFYSSFGRNWQGPVDSIAAYGVYFRRGAEGGAHGQPWHYYLGLLLAHRPAKGFFWTEAIIGVMAIVGVVAVMAVRHGRRRTALETFLVGYAVALTALYALIPYKTPWCLLGFWHAVILVAGIGCAAAFRTVPGRWGKAVVALVVLAGAAHLGRQTYWLNFRLPADARNPFCYVHTTRDAVNLAQHLERLAAVSPDRYDTPLHVVMPNNYWPLPWYLRRFDAAGYWDDVKKWRNDAASAPSPGVLLIDPSVETDLNLGLKAKYNRQMLASLRPGVFVRVLVRDDLWQAFLDRQAKGG